MGEYTVFGLTTLGHNLASAECMTAMRADERFTQFVARRAGHQLESDHSATSGRPIGPGARWYYHEMELREFSKLHPSVVIWLHGEAVDFYDPLGPKWDKYFQNGKMQIARTKIVEEVEPFDPTRLE